MINNSDFAKRLTIIMEYFQISASVFADRIQVPRSSISHLLSGRNKPSLDFVLKVINEFEEVELYWLLNGKGNFPKSAPPSSLRSDSQSQPKFKLTTEESVSNQVMDIKGTSNNIERIVIFYNDGTFKEYRP